ncbi:MAG: hypothetical protein UZ18_ATM001001859 [Armatimonadetes bacterium OLB18]|nr:MAG: hypothetical protein UZ18_ATM001001859 [Armatimonadetes bacterium OLB18]
MEHEPAAAVVVKVDRASAGADRLDADRKHLVEQLIDVGVTDQLGCGKLDGPYESLVGIHRSLILQYAAHGLSSLGAPSIEGSTARRGQTHPRTQG